MLTGSLRKKTKDVRVKINHRFFHDVHPIPTPESSNLMLDEGTYRASSRFILANWIYEVEKNCKLRVGNII